MEGRIIHALIEQRSAEWYKLREGRITASNVVNILGNLNHKKCQDAIDNMAMEKAIESVHGMIETDYVSFDMQRGIDSEPAALRLLSNILGEQFIEVNPIAFAEISEHSGASPDGLASDGSNIEIKCPNIKNFFKVKLASDIDRSHYAQMQKQMLCTNTLRTYYFNYCVHHTKEFYDLKVVERDDEMISLIQDREAMVISKKLEYVEILNTIESN